MRKVLFLSASFLSLFFSCKEDGILQPDFAKNTTLNIFTDTARVTSETLLGDTILADKISTGLAGIYLDSLYGKSTASFVVQPLLPTNFLVLGEPNDQLFCDSLILSLEYNGHYGDITVPQTLEVFRVDEQLDFTKSYYSNSVISFLPNAVASKTFTPNVDSTLKIINPNLSGGSDTILLNPQLRIALDVALGNEILAQDESVFANNESFTAFLNGLKVNPLDPGNIGNYQQAIMYYALTSSNSKLTLYYHSISSNNDTVKKSVDFPINSSSTRFNLFNHDYSNSEVGNAIQNSNFDSQYSYTIAMAGAHTLIKFPNLKSSFENKNLIINKAELIIPVAEGKFSEFGFPSSLIVASKNADGALQFIPDFFEGSSYFGGTYDAVNKNYKFNIARYIQGLINGSENDGGLTLLVSGSAVKAERAVIFGVDNPSNKIKLNLYYSNTN